MIFGDLVGLKFPDICLTGDEKPRKHLTQETCLDRGSNPGPLRDKCASTTCSTAVDPTDLHKKENNSKDVSVLKNPKNSDNK